MKCPYCDSSAVFLESSESLYHGRNYGPVYACIPCQAWVGCHRGTKQPLGRIANAELRRAKVSAHASFDGLWRAKMRISGVSKGKARGLAYAWLAKQLGIDPQHCHIGMFDLAMCERVVEVCKPYVIGRAVSV